MEEELHRITLRKGERTTDEAISRLIAEADVTTDWDLSVFTPMANLLSQIIRDDDEARADVFVQQHAGESFLCLTVQTGYFAVKARDNSLQAFASIIADAYSVVCHAVNEDLLTIQIKFDL